MGIGDHLRTKMILWGAPACVNTAKCVHTAGEKGVDLDTAAFDPASSEVQAMSPLGVGPILKDVDHVVVGHIAIMSYLDDKGFGPSLVIRNGVIRAVQHQWASYTTDVVQPNMENDQVLGKAFDLLNDQLSTTDVRMRGDFICGQFSLADIHWAACANMLIINGKRELVEQRPAIKSWWESVKQHPSTSKEKLVPFECVATEADVRSNNLRGISINA